MTNAMLNILVIDDDPIHHELVATCFRARSGVTLARALNGAEAQQHVVGGTPFDLILCDIYMPDFDGCEFITFLRDQACRTPLIIVTGAPESIVTLARTLAKGYGLPLVGTIRKPLSFPALVKLVEPVLAKASLQAAPQLGAVAGRMTAAGSG